jgi:hypothetical protein
MPTITLPDGKTKSFDKPVTGLLGWPRRPLA